MATNATWTVVFEDQTVIKQTGDAAKTGYIINDDVFGINLNFQTFGLFNMVLQILLMK